MSLKYFLLFSFSLTLTCTAQRIEWQTSNPNLLQNNKGFLFTDIVSQGKQKTLKLVQYNQELQPTDSLEQPVKKERYVVKAFPYGYEIWSLYNLLGRKGAFLRVDTNLKRISFNEYDQQSIELKKMEESVREPDPDQYYNYFQTFDKSISIGENMFRLNGNANKETVINGYKRKPSEVFQFYKQQWELVLPHQGPIINYKFYQESNENAYLYTSIKENEKWTDYFYCFNYFTGKMVYQIKPQLQDTSFQTTVSNVFINTDDHSVLLAGAYYRKGQKERNATVEGYFLMLIDANGNIVKQKKFCITITYY